MSWAVVAAVVVRPWLWPTAVLQVSRLAPRGWWRRWPPFPSPDPDYLRFRLVTAYGDPSRRADAMDVVAWLSWCRGRS
ncbi:MAG: hypothetical protein ACYDAD_01900 [Acidimicrobiales bacterium]